MALIPLVQDGINQVYSFLACSLGEDSVKIRLLRGDAYAGYGKTFQLDTLSAEFVAMNCMILEYRLFGHDSYRVNDLELFRQSPAGTSNESRFIFIKDFIDSSKVERVHNGRTTDAYIPMWTTYCVDWEVEGYQGQVVGVAPGETPDYGYSGSNCYEVLTFFTIIGGGPTVTIPVTGGGGGSGGGGGGALNQWWEEDPCHHGSIPGCGNDVTFGWMPTDDMGDYFDDYEDWGYKHFETWDVTAEDYAKIQNWRLNNIDTTGLDSCVRKILDKLTGNQNLIGRILAKMERSNEYPLNIEQFRIKLKVDTLTGNWGKTKRGYFDPFSQVFTDTIIIKDSLVMFGTELAVAQTIMHEMIHAYMKSIFHRFFYNSYTANEISGFNIDTLFNVYVDTLLARHTRKNLNNWISTNTEYDHNFMANKLMVIMNETLAYIDDNRNTDEYYWALNWGGLEKTTTMRRYWPNAPVWPPTSGYPAPHNDSTWGLRYALTEPRLDSISRWNYRENHGSSLAKGRPKIPGGCY